LRRIFFLKLIQVDKRHSGPQRSNKSSLRWSIRFSGSRL
jgi:hypothetical protein